MVPHYPHAHVFCPQKAQQQVNKAAFHMPRCSLAAEAGYRFNLQQYMLCSYRMGMAGDCHCHLHIF